MKPEQRVGTVLAGYRIEKLIGRGGMGVVYLAEHLHLERTVALKVLAPELDDDETFRQRFIRESRLAAALNHPNVIPIYDAGEAEDDILYIAMHFVSGTDLSQVLHQDGALDPQRTVSIVGQVGRALDAAHSRGLLHRDVKPANILISSEPDWDNPEHVYLSDFGLAKRFDSRSRLTGTRVFLGTVDYAAPEQFQAPKTVDGRTDVYSLGCVMFECLTGVAPYERDEDFAVMYAHLTEPTPKASGMRPGLPPGLDDVLARAMAKKKEDRYPTCGAFADAAQAELDRAGPVTVGPPRTDRPAGTPARPGGKGTATTPAPESAAPAAGVTFTNSGHRYLLGYGRESYGIWDRSAPGPPLAKYPRSDAGWQQAWATFHAWEASGAGTPSPSGPAAPSSTSSHPPRPSVAVPASQPQAPVFQPPVTPPPVSVPAYPPVFPQQTRPVSGGWWVLPIVFGWLGGLIAYFAVRDRDRGKAKRMLITGIVITVVLILAVAASSSGSG